MCHQSIRISLLAQHDRKRSCGQSLDSKTCLTVLLECVCLSQIQQSAFGCKSSRGSNILEASPTRIGLIVVLSINEQISSTYGFHLILPQVLSPIKAERLWISLQHVWLEDTYQLIILVLVGMSSPERNSIWWVGDILKINSNSRKQDFSIYLGNFCFEEESREQNRIANSGKTFDIHNENMLHSVCAIRVWSKEHHDAFCGAKHGLNWRISPALVTKSPGMTMLDIQRKPLVFLKWKFQCYARQLRALQVPEK